MDTNELIRTLAEDARRPAMQFTTTWWVAVSLAITFDAAVFLAIFGPRPDIAAAAETFRFLFKFLVTITLAASAFGCARALSRPGETWRSSILCLATAPALIVMAVVVELFTLPPDTWSATIIGKNNIVCLAYISLTGLGPLAIFLWTLRFSAPTRPALAGAAAGLLAGGIAATFYAAQCTDDSPLFVATWYTFAIAILAIVGAFGARRFAHW